MPSNPRNVWTKILLPLLMLCSLPLYGAAAAGAGGSVLSNFPTSNSRCVYGYYMPLRVYNDPYFTTEINDVIHSNYVDGARRVMLPIFYHSLSNTNACDEFYADPSGSVPAEFAQNFPALMARLQQEGGGYGEVVLQFQPLAELMAQCNEEKPMWCGSSTQWGPAHDAILQKNIAFITNILQFAFAHANNHNIWVDAVFYEPGITSDRNCGNYDAGYCTYGGTANLQHHTRYGLEAKFITLLWDALASHSFNNGSYSFPGKNQIYGFETNYRPYDPGFQKIPTLYTVPDASVTMTGLYTQTAAGAPWVVPIGSYPTIDPNCQCTFLDRSRDEMNGVIDQLNRAGDQSGIIVVETWNNDADTAQGFNIAMNMNPSRTVWFLTQWGWTKPEPGHDEIPRNFNNYHLWYF